jgi:hypothetical protein
MKLSATEQESIIALLTRIYGDIYAIELEFQLLAGDHDFRPRIDYFHDAVRAFSARDAGQPEPGERLSVELLAYDVSCLRYIQSMPLAPFRPHGVVLSPHSDMVKVDPALTVKPKRPDRALREHIAELYQSYAVLFSALLKPMADRDYKERIGDLNTEVQDINTLIQQLQGVNSGKTSVNTLVAAIQQLDEDELRHLLSTFVQQQKYNKKEDVRKLTQFLKGYSIKKDGDIDAIETAHMNYALAQLGIFEGSRDMLKKMAGQGLNLVGKFVDASMAETRRQVGR